MAQRPTPAISPALIEYLEERFPNTVPEEGQESLAEVHRVQGTQRVLSHLRALLSSQERKNRESSITIK